MGKTRKKIHKKKNVMEIGKHNSKKRAWVNFGFVIVSLIFVFLFFFILSKRSNSSEHGGNTHTEGETQKMVVTQEQKYQSVNDIHMDAETGAAQIDFYNDADSSVSVVVTIQLKEGDVLYTSDLLKPGDTLDQVIFEQKLEKGEYDIEISVDSYSLNGDEMVGGIIYDRKLVVE